MVEDKEITYGFGKPRKFVSTSNDDLSELKESTTSNSEKIRLLMEQNLELKEMVSNLSEQLSKALKTNSKPIMKRSDRKNIIKNRILEMAETQRYAVSEMKDIIVDLERLCSKATFYRHISDLKNNLEEISINGKEVVMLRKI